MAGKATPPERTTSVEIPTRMLVHGLVRADGTVDAGELYTVAGALGMTDQQVRLCIKRLVGEGQFTLEGRGRRALLRATAATQRAIAPNIEFVRYAFRQDRGQAPWDRTWHLVAFAVPESARTARDALRDTIGWLGGAPLQGGLYVSANAWEELVDAEAHRLGLADNVTFIASHRVRVGGEEDPARLAATLWPIPEISHRYVRLIDIARPRLARLDRAHPLTQTDLLTIAMELAAEFGRAMQPDPLLPPELLPQPWPGTQARALIARCWAKLLHRYHPTATPQLFRLYADVVSEATDPDGRGSD